MALNDGDDKAFSVPVPAQKADREQQLREFAEASLGLDPAGLDWSAITGDASARRYFRLAAGDRSWICADSPPASEKNEEFFAVRALLAGAGLPVPGLEAIDLGRGLLVLEDFGDRHLLQELNADEPPVGYAGALALLLEIQGVDATGGVLPVYSREVLEEEFSRFQEWFCAAWLELAPEPGADALIDHLGKLLVESALEQPQVFVFRDYHSRNLLIRPGGELGLIDFQDAVLGPLCYDLASLLKDCYIRWPADRARAWALEFRRDRLAGGLPAGADDEEFLRWFDWTGLHRHLKVLGNFTRLSLRDGKHGYLADIPMVLDYVREVLAAYPEFEEFHRWFSDTLEPLLATQRWEPRP